MKTTSLWTQERCDAVNALREHEAAHKVWMNTSVFSPEAAAARAALDVSRTKYTKAKEIWDKQRRTKEL